jgi:D-alanyl-D-alanine carboxypeptidase/D-alanyl-D-alanine-endopeptidase (penicillin-binding protein 4)
MSLLRNTAFWLTLTLPMPLAAAPADMETQVRSLLAQPDLAGTHWGLQVEDKNGQPIISIAPDERFQPASNTKIFVTAAAFEALSRGALPNPARRSGWSRAPRACRMWRSSARATPR